MIMLHEILAITKRYHVFRHKRKKKSRGRGLVFLRKKRRDDVVSFRCCRNILIILGNIFGKTFQSRWTLQYHLLSFYCLLYSLLERENTMKLCNYLDQNMHFSRASVSLAESSRELMKNFGEYMNYL